MAGVNRSGDLKVNLFTISFIMNIKTNLNNYKKDPAKSIPRGSLGGQLFTSFFYFMFPVFYAGMASKDVLIDTTTQVT